MVCSLLSITLPEPGQRPEGLPDGKQHPCVHHQQCPHLSPASSLTEVSSLFLHLFPFLATHYSQEEFPKNWEPIPSHLGHIAGYSLCRHRVFPS